MSLIQTALTATLLLPFHTVHLAPAARQSTVHGSASVTISPPEATVHVGQTQTFEAVVRGTQSTGIRWAVAERNGGTVNSADPILAPPERFER